jgi:hypothetical protein
MDVTDQLDAPAAFLPFFYKLAKCKRKTQQLGKFVPKLLFHPLYFSLLLQNL